MLIMRHELLLVAITVILLLVEIFLPQDKKDKIILPAILLMALVTIVGFIPGPTGVLFGGMYGTSPLILLMKNILNIGVLIIFIQSVSWLKLEEQKEKIGEYFIILLSTLIGMNYMISSGDFLMFYLGLELATIPLATLAAFERFQGKISRSRGKTDLYICIVIRNSSIWTFNDLRDNRHCLFSRGLRCLQCCSSADPCIYLFLCRHGIQDLPCAIPPLDSRRL